MTTASIAIYARQGRAEDYTINLFESDGSTEFPLQASDVVRIKIGRGAGEPDLDLDSDTPPDHQDGCRVTFTAATNDVVLRLSGLATREMEPGAYDVEVLVCPADESGPEDEPAKHVQYGVLFLHPTMGGSVGLEQSSGSSSSGDSSGSSSSSSS